MFSATHKLFNSFNKSGKRVCTASRVGGACFGMIISFGWKASLVTGFNVNHRYRNADPADCPRV